MQLKTAKNNHNWNLIKILFDKPLVLPDTHHRKHNPAVTSKDSTICQVCFDLLPPEGSIKVTRFWTWPYFPILQRAIFLRSVSIHRVGLLYLLRGNYSTSHVRFPKLEWHWLSHSDSTRASGRFQGDATSGVKEVKHKRQTKISL